LPDPRDQQIRDWLQQFAEIAGADLQPASADASFRRYFRVKNGDTSRIVMDAPPGKEDCAPFLRIASWLRSMQLNAPRVHAADPEQGMLLLSDLGTTQYLDVLNAEPGRADELYADAIGALLTLQREGVRYCAELPPYDEKLLRAELALFSEWLCGTHLGIRFSDSESQQWQAVVDSLVSNALDQPSVFVHRDYHSRNLMLVNDNNPGILDFQDAVCGPYTYDLVSLLKDCYIAWPPGRIIEWALSFFRKREAAPGSISEESFLRHFELMGVQRHLKAAGIFARLNHRDGKPGFMHDVPRTLNYVLEISPRYGELDFLADLIANRIMPCLGKPDP